MLFLLLQDREDPGRSLVTRTASAYRGSPDQDPVAINITSLFSDADDHDHGTGGHGLAHPQKLAFLQLINGSVDWYGGFCAPKRYRISSRRSLKHDSTHNAHHQPKLLNRSPHRRHVNFPV